MNRLQISNFSQEEFVEFAYIAGLHKSAKIIGNALGLSLLKISKKYEYNHSTEKKFNDELNNELKTVKDFATWISLNLREAASVLPAGSNILEIGTYVGGTSVALLQGANIATANTGIDVYAGFS